MFHTFLLDRNGKVVLVGDPVNNPGLWELYKKTIAQLIEKGGEMPVLQRGKILAEIFTDKFGGMKVIS